MEREVIGYNVYYAPDGCDVSFCGRYPDLDSAMEATDHGLARSDWDTARAAGHCAGMTAPDTDGEADEPEEWFGPDGYHCAVAVYATAGDE